MAIQLSDEKKPIKGLPLTVQLHSSVVKDKNISFVPQI